jgi:hypothetical protein
VAVGYSSPILMQILRSVRNYLVELNLIGRRNVDMEIWVEMHFTSWLDILEVVQLTGGEEYKVNENRKS